MIASSRRAFSLIFLVIVFVHLTLSVSYAQFNEANVTDCSDGNGQFDHTKKWPEKDPKTGKIGLIEKPCDDTTASGQTFAGKCIALGSCRG